MSGPEAAGPTPAVARAATGPVVVGVGASRGCAAAELLALVDEALAACGSLRGDVAALASVDAKAGEPGILEAAATLGVDARFVPAATLAAVRVPTPSERVLRELGTGSVAEAAAIVVASPVGGPEPARLLVTKLRSPHGTCAIADAGG